MNFEEVKECFINAKKSDAKGKKHKGMLLVNPNLSLAEKYIFKAKETLDFCEIYRNKRADYKLPEEWFYAQYYCALAILIKFGVESRSQKYTAVFLSYLKEKGIINYDSEFIKRITVYSNKEEESDVDKRENARYGAVIKDEQIIVQYDKMMSVCKRAISQCEDIVYSKEKLEIPRELKDILGL
ncbi:MAG: hypothetical protein AABX11_03410 [Nanoarchaeota archaeon]